MAVSIQSCHFFEEEIAYCKAHHVWSIHSSICLNLPILQVIFERFFLFIWSSGELSNSMSTFQWGRNHKPTICFFCFYSVPRYFTIKSPFSFGRRYSFFSSNQIYAVWQVDAYDSLFPTHMTLLLKCIKLNRTTATFLRYCWLLLEEIHRNPAPGWLKPDAPCMDYFTYISWKMATFKKKYR